MKLLIVESPTKAKKLRQFLPGDFRIEASYGHVRDLPAGGGLGVAFRDGTVIPDYQVIERAQRAIRELRSQAARAEEVLLATDPDREGEAIAWHVAELLGDGVTSKRVTFNAITKDAVLRALDQARPIDLRLVGAQQARRVLDRVVGWLVSPTLRRGVGRREARSAGRVQSVALRLLAEREREIQAFTARDYFVLEARLEHADRPPSFVAKLVEWKGEALEYRLGDRATAEKTVDWCRRQEWRVLAVDRREQQRRPPPPFVTATVQQASSVRLRLTPERTMQLLQQLFENGHITYHRTDSVALAPEAVTAARAEIAERFPAEYLPAKPVLHSAKAANTQEAHEAIRPTAAGRDRLGDDEAGKLYRLIWERFIASQMAPGRDFLTGIKVAVAPEGRIEADGSRHPVGVFEARGKVVRFDGWRRLTGDATDERKTKRKRSKQADAEEDAGAVLPDLAVGDAVACQELNAVAKTTKAPSRYTQASLIKKLEAVGVGRPSTYASILGTLLKRDYAAEKRHKLHATELGCAVVDFLVQRFGGNFIDVDFTARMEDELDSVAAGNCEWQGTVTRAAEAVRDLARAAGLGWDPLAGEGPPPPPQAAPEAGPCPRCGGGMRKIHGRYGPFYGCAKRECRGTRKIGDEAGDGGPSTPA